MRVASSSSRIETLKTSTALTYTGIGLLAVLTVGCDLAKYESQMRDAQARVALFEEENRYLGDPLAIPTKKVAAKEGSPPKTIPVVTSFFLRAPKGIRTTPDADPLLEILYRYPKEGTPSPKPDAAPADNPLILPLPSSGSVLGITDLFLAFSTDPSATFAEKVVAQIPHADPVQKKNRVLEVLNREQPLNFDVREFNDDQSAWSINTHTEDKTTVAIIYRIEKAKKGSVNTAIELSLATLALGPEAEFVKTSYSRRPKPRIAAPPATPGS